MCNYLDNGWLDGGRNLIGSALAVENVGFFEKKLSLKVRTKNCVIKMQKFSNLKIVETKMLTIFFGSNQKCIYQMNFS